MYLQRAVSSSQAREAAPSHMVGRVTIFSHWENWWKVKAVEGRGREEGWENWWKAKAVEGRRGA